jgi:NAD(P)-dependent dehydrogenase (short-subunit alcohol dehydrogenase family)
VDVSGRIVVVTGGASGIGRALAKRFAAEGARKVVCVDLDEAGARETAASIDGIAMRADVAQEADVVRVIEATEKDVGPIDLFCCNAGVGAGPELSSPDSEWQLAWGVNVMAHVYAARHLVPRMLARGGGYFLNTSSAAGLLSQIGNAAYATTKHAAVGFAEWLAISYGHRGIKVSLLCPQAVRTPMTQNDANAAVQAAAGDGMMEPEELAECVVEGLRQESFLILTHGQVVEYMRRKTADYDRWIRGMNRLHQRLVDGEG